MCMMVYVMTNEYIQYGDVCDDEYVGSHDDLTLLVKIIEIMKYLKQTLIVL